MGIVRRESRAWMFLPNGKWYIPTTAVSYRRRRLTSRDTILGSTSLWQSEQNESGKALSSNPLQGTLDTEVAVIGAGITGTATALWLARAGVQVRVLEARSIAAGASGRNGGFISYGTTALYTKIIQRYGREQA